MNEKQLYEMACLLDAPFEDGGSGSGEVDKSLEARARALVREIVATGRAHPLHGAMSRLVGGTIVLRRMWESALNRPVPGISADMPASVLRL